MIENEIQHTEGSDRRWWELDSAALHVLAMLLMLSDHSWSTLFPSQRWMTSIGRIAFPLFAFMIAEGYYRTSDYRKYLKRLILCGILSEIPFNLMMSGNLIAPFHQNVMWNFLIALLGMKTIDRIKEKQKGILKILLIAGVVLACFVLGFATCADYFGTGVLMTLTFYFFHGKQWWNYLGQFAVMYWLNMDLLAGYCFFIHIGEMRFEIVEQGIALLALIPIWLYRGRQGYHTKGFRTFCYLFYPAHMLALYLIGVVLY